MTRIISKYKSVCMALALGCSLALTTSCTDYLDKSPESDVSAEDAFKNFKNFQGFTEELYLCIPDFSKSYWTTSWNWGEDDIQAVGINYHMSYKYLTAFIRKIIFTQKLTLNCIKQVWNPCYCSVFSKTTL